MVHFVPPEIRIQESYWPWGQPIADQAQIIKKQTIIFVTKKKES